MFVVTGVTMALTHRIQYVLMYYPMLIAPVNQESY